MRHIEVSGGGVETPVSAYFPLAMGEVRQLLAVAREAAAPEASSVQVRLCQGIPGYVSPAPRKGDVARKKLEISRLFVDNIRKKGVDIDGLARRVVEIYHS